jgi:uncharacterized protein (TIGR03437 family)
MVYSVAGRVSAIVPYAVSGTVQVQVEYQGADGAVAVPVAASAPGIFLLQQAGSRPGDQQQRGGVISCNDGFVPPAPASVVTFFLTSDGIPSPPIADGRLPAGPRTRSHRAMGRKHRGIDAPPCAATFAGLVAGLTQVNVCIPEGVARTASVPLVFPLRCRIQRHGHHRPATETVESGRALRRSKVGLTNIPRLTERI